VQFGTGFSVLDDRYTLTTLVSSKPTSLRIAHFACGLP